MLLTISEFLALLDGASATVNTGLKAGSHDIAVGTANIQGLPRMPITKVLHDRDVVSHVVRLAGLQEIERPEYKRAIDELRKDGWHVIGLEHECPIIADGKLWDALDTGVVMLSAGVAGLSPTRYLTWARLKHRPTGVVLIMNNTHYASEAWGAHGNSEAETKIRRNLWLEENRIHIEHVKGWVTDGLPIIGTGDFNRMHYPIIGVSVAGRRVRYGVIDGIDYVWSVNGKGVRLDPVTKNRTALNSDHDLRYVTIRIRTGKGVDK